MTFASTQPMPRSPTPARAFFTVFLGVFLVVFVSSGLITFVLPERFVAAARVRLPAGEELEVFRSGATLARVADQLDLGRELARRYGEREPFGLQRTSDMLRRGLEVRRVGDSSLAEVRVYSYSPDEAARLANAIARTGVSNAARLTRPDGEAPVIIELAAPSSRPVRPHQALNLVLGALVGVFLGIMAGGVGARLALIHQQRSTP